MVTRNQVYDALFALLQTAWSFTTKECVYVKPDLVLPVNCDALFQVQKIETTTSEKQVHGTPLKHKMSVDLFIYSYTSDGTWPRIKLNNIVDAIENTISAPIGQQTQTLGGLVEWVLPDSSGTKFYQHPSQNLMMAIMPVSMLKFGPSR